MARKKKSTPFPRSVKNSIYREIDPKRTHSEISSPYITNKINPSDFTFWNLFPLTLFLEFRKLPYFWFVLVIILEMTFSLKELTLRYYNILSFSILLFSSLMQNMVHLWHSSRLGNKFNNREVKKWKNFNFQKVFSRNLLVGDVILISKGEEVPADVILLDCQGGKKAMFDKSRNLGIKDYVEKVPVDSFNVLKELDHNEIFYSLTRIEKLSVTLPSMSFKKFKAKIRYRGDPKTYLAGVNSLVIGGSVLVSSDWILGLVVYTGMETKYWLNSKSTLKTKLSVLAVTINKVFTLNFVFVVCLVIVSVTIASFNQSKVMDFVIEESIVWYIILYSNLISISYFVVLKISRILAAFVIMMKNKHFEIDPMSLQELGRVEYLIIDKEDLIKHKNMKISSVFLKDLTYFRQEGIKKRHSIGDNENLIKSTGIAMSVDNNYLGFEQLKESSLNQTDNSDFFEYFSCALFTSLSFLPDLQKPTRENEKIFKLSKRLGVSLEQKSNEMYLMTFQGTTTEYLVAGSYKNTKKTFVLVTFPYQSKGWIYLKSDQRLHSRSHLEVSPSVFESHDFLAKYKTYYFYKISLTREVLEQIIYDYNNALSSSINSNGKLQTLFETHSESPEFLGCINFQYKHHKSIRKTLSDLQNIGIKTWMVSGNNGRNALLAAYSSKLFRNSSKVRYLVGATDLPNSIEMMKKIFNEESLEQQELEKQNEVLQSLIQPFSNVSTSQNPIIKQSSPTSRRSIQNIRRNKTLRSLIIKKIEPKDFKTQICSNMNLKLMSFSLVIDSEFLDFALSAEASRRLLSSLLLVSDSVCFYGLNPDQKRSLVKLLKKNFEHNPTVMAVGDVMCDWGMLEEADISVLIEKGKDNNPYFNPCITVPKFSDLKRLILVEGHYSYVRLSKILHYSLFKESMICMLVLMHQIKTGWSCTPIIGYHYFILFELFITLLPILIVGVLEKDCDAKICKTNKKVYAEGVFDSMMTLKRLSFYMFFGAFQGLLIFLICSSAFKGTINSKGFTEDSELQSVLYFLCTSLSLLLKTLMTTRKFYFPTIISPFLSFFFIILLVFYFSEDLFEIISNQGIFWIIGLTVPLFITFEYFVFNILQRRFFSVPFLSRKESYYKRLDALYKDSDDWKSAEKQEELEINKKTLEFNSQFEEKMYQDQIAEDSNVVIKAVISLISSACFIYLILVYTEKIDYLRYRHYAAIPVGFSLFFVISSFLHQIQRFKLFFWLNLFLVTSLLVYSSVNPRYTASYYASLQILFSIFMIFKWKFTVIQVTLTYLASLYSIVYQGILLNNSNAVNTSLHSFFLVSGISSLCLIVSYCIDLSKREEHLSIRKAETQFNKSNQILSYLLPEFVKKRVNDGIRYIAEEKGVVSVVFCDICDFDKIIEQCEEKEIISILDDLFSRFDSICDTIGVSKIETVGKTYMACAGLKDFDSDLLSEIYEVSHARRAIELAFAVIEECQKTFLSNGESLKMKIGIHSGPVIAGVVGFHKPQFSLVGDTVNTASRMASTLTSSNKIQISKETYHFLDDLSGLHFINNYPEVKGKGKLHTLMVEPVIIKNIGKSDYDETIEMSSSFKRESVHTEKFSRYTNLEKYSSAVLVRNFDFSRTFSEKFRQIFCCESKEENKLQNKMLEKQFNLQQLGLLVFIIVNFSLILVEAGTFHWEKNDENHSTLVIVVLQEAFALGLFFILKRLKVQKISAFLLFFLYFFGLFSFLVTNIFYEPNYPVDMLFFTFISY